MHNCYVQMGKPDSGPTCPTFSPASALSVTFHLYYWGIPPMSLKKKAEGIQGTPFSFVGLKKARVVQRHPETHTDPSFWRAQIRLDQHITDATQSLNNNPNIELEVHRTLDYSWSRTLCSKQVNTRCVCSIHHTVKKTHVPLIRITMLTS